MTAGTILLVEDNPDDVALTRRALQRCNIINPLFVARDGVEAFAYLYGTADAAETAGPIPAVVLLDINLPRINGLEVLQKIRSHPRTRLLPVVVLTSSREEEDLVKSYSLGANSYIRKPVDFDHFVETVSHLGLYWLLINEQPASGG